MTKILTKYFVGNMKVMLNVMQNIKFTACYWPQDILFNAIGLRYQMFYNQSVEFDITLQFVGRSFITFSNILHQPLK